MSVPPDAGRLLLPLARAAIASHFGRRLPVPKAGWLDETGASFVTITIDGRLRGCIGTLNPYRSLRDDVWANARSAAFNDPRFSPLTPTEYERIRIEVSVLTEPVEMHFTNLADALAQLVPGVDGVILTAGRRRATFLPQVWEHLPEPHEFIGALMRKAGLADDDRQTPIQLERYRVQAWTERRAPEDRPTTTDN